MAVDCSVCVSISNVHVCILYINSDKYMCVHQHGYSEANMAAIVTHVCMYIHQYGVYVYRHHMLTTAVWWNAKSSEVVIWRYG